MSIVFFRGDPRRYIRYKDKGDHHFYIDCTETKIVDGITKTCSYTHKREDKHKEKMTKGTMHECHFIIKATRNAIDKYLLPKGEDIKLLYSEDGIKSHLCLLIAQKNISIDIGASKEMYDFIIYCISYGIFIHKEGANPIELAQTSYHHFKSTTLSKELIAVSNDIHKKMLAEFKKADYVSVAIDEGSTAKVQNLDFNIENPLLPFKPYPVTTKVLTRADAEGYVQIILDGLSSINIYQIKIGTCICDGNLAQRKAFSFEWTGSLRKLAQPEYSWIKEIIYIPCLCHRVDNSYKYHVNHDAQLTVLLNEVRENSKVLAAHRKEIGAKCPQFVSTRWVYDYEILRFIKHHDTGDLINANPQFEPLYDILFIFKSLILIFENPNTYFWRAFFYIERAVRALEELQENQNPFAEGFCKSLLRRALGIGLFVHKRRP